MIKAGSLCVYENKPVKVIDNDGPWHLVKTKNGSEIEVHEQDLEEVI